MNSSSLSELVISLAIQLPVFLASCFLLAIGIIRATRGYGGTLVILAAVISMVMPLLSAAFWSVVFPALADQFNSQHIALIVRGVAMVESMVWAIPYVLIAISLFPRNTLRPKP